MTWRGLWPGGMCSTWRLPPRPHAAVVDITLIDLGVPVLLETELPTQRFVGNTASRGFPRVSNETLRSEVPGNDVAWAGGTCAPWRRATGGTSSSSLLLSGLELSDTTIYEP